MLEFDFFRKNHHPIFLWIALLLFIVGIIFYKSSMIYIKYFAYILSMSILFLIRYLVDVHFLEELNKNRPLLYGLLWGLFILIFAVLLPDLLIRFLN